MKLKLTADGKAEVKDGLPVYVHDDGKEIGFDAPGAMGKISSLQGENKSHRERAEAAETKLKTFDGIKDAAAAVKALETVANLDAGQLVKAGEVETIKQAAVKASDEKIAALNKTHAEDLATRDSRFNKLQANFHRAVISNAFASSQFVKDKLAVTPGVAQKIFEENFRVEDSGQIIGLDSSGNKIFSRSRPGEIANFHEALEVMVDGYVDRDHILKGKGGGSGKGPDNGAGGKNHTITRSEFELLNPAQQRAVLKEKEIVDG